MKFLFDLFPLLTFFIAFKMYDIYVATAASIIASFIQVGWYWGKHRRFQPLPSITLAILVVFGGMTLALQNDIFIKWKPTIINWIFAALIFGSQYLGRKNVIERLLGNQFALARPIWLRLNLSWGIFFLLLGALNLYVAFFYGPDLDAETRRSIWVNFKVFGLLGLTLAFTLAQGLFLSKYLEKAEKDKS
ncbi:MAG TPA: septation protein A [Acidiferrobacterales bacterium]|nr:septation protein A [Acidiferrobacterales bacterium]